MSMGIDSANIPPAMRRYLPPADHLSIAAAQKRHAALDAKLERELHEEFGIWLDQHARRMPVPFVHSRMDKASTIQQGWPDFTVLWGGRACCVEFKLDGNNLSEAQTKCIVALNAAGVPVFVAYDVPSAINFVKRTTLT